MTAPSPPLQVLLDSAAWLGMPFQPSDAASLAAPLGTGPHPTGYLDQLTRRFRQLLDSPSLQPSDRLSLLGHARAVTTEPTLAGLALQAIVGTPTPPPAPALLPPWAVTDEPQMPQSPPWGDLPEFAAPSASTPSPEERYSDVAVHDEADRPTSPSSEPVAASRPRGPAVPPATLSRASGTAWNWDRSASWVKRRTRAVTLLGVAAAAIAFIDTSTLEAARDRADHLVRQTLWASPVPIEDADRLRTKLLETRERVVALPSRIPVDDHRRLAIDECLDVLDLAIDASGRLPPAGVDLFTTADRAHESCSHAIELASQPASES